LAGEMGQLVEVIPPLIHPIPLAKMP
jgi:hypothetical protein